MNIGKEIRRSIDIVAWGAVNRPVYDTVNISVENSVFNLVWDTTWGLSWDAIYGSVRNNINRELKEYGY
jgi:hypothetical protein